MPTEVVGVVELKKALNKYAPDLAKELTKELGAILKPVVNEARSYVPLASPMSGWSETQNPRGKFPKYNALEIRKGIIYKTTPSKPNNKGFRSLARVFNKSAAGAIYETMGRKTPQSRFVQNQMAKSGGQMKGRDKQQGRAIFRAYEENNGKAREAVLKAIQNAADKLNARAKV